MSTTIEQGKPSPLQAPRCWARATPYARWLIFLVIAFVCLYLVTGDDGAPGGHLFAIAFIFVLSAAAGILVTKIGMNLPPLLGMLCVGFAMRNLPHIGDRVGARVDSGWSSAVRSLALTLILCRAGLSLDLAALQRLRFVVARLALLPGLSEASVIALLSSAWLEFPFEWALMLGFVVAAISPAVVIPSLLSLQNQGYGVKTGIPPLVIAAAALDDVFAIAGFGISLSFATGGSEERWLDYARAPLELVLGIVIGIVGGFLLTLLVPTEVDAIQGKQWRVWLLMGLAVTIFFSLKKADFSGASALAVLCLAASSAKGWGSANTKEVTTFLGNCWNQFAQPLLFGLVGAAISVEELEGRIVGYGLGMLACSILTRLTVTFLAVGCRGLRWQERVFTALAWIPKATVQAAIGGIALDEAQTSEEKKMGRDILNIAVLSILCTAPLGAAIISLAGPKLLIKDDPEATSASEVTEATAVGKDNHVEKPDEKEAVGVPATNTSTADTPEVAKQATVVSL
jgi:NhaP-type Na+/H+ or K+/H+ antiporter